MGDRRKDTGATPRSMATPQDWDNSGRMGTPLLDDGSSANRRPRQQQQPALTSNSYSIQGHDDHAPVSHAAPKPKGNRKEVTRDEIAESTDHFISLQELSDRFPQSNINLSSPRDSRGLSQTEASRRLLQFGHNALTPPERESLFVLFLKQFRDPFLILLVIAGGLSFVTYALDGTSTDLYSAVALIVVVILTALLAFVQEAKVANVMEKFSKMLPSACMVIRDGIESSFDAHDLVPGDIVKVKGGDKVPADLRIIFCQNLKVENASITGESKPITLTANPSPEGVAPTESACLAFKASNCVEGEAMGLVVRTGDRTFIGQIAHLTSSSAPIESTLRKEIKHFIKFIAIMSLTMAAIAYGVALLRVRFTSGTLTGDDALKIFISGFVIIVVANVPQGLPATVTSVLAITARRMAQQNVLVKRLDVVETLGAATLIASDKTGTLTRNEMNVTEIWIDGRNHSGDYGTLFFRRSRPRTNSEGSRPRSRSRVSRNYVDDEADNTSHTSSHYSRGRTDTNAREGHLDTYASTFEMLHRLGTVCNKTLVSPKNDGSAELDFNGNASDVATMRFCNGLRSAASVREQWPVDFEIPFNSTNKYMLTVCHEAGVREQGTNRTFTVMMKGAPEVVLDRCST